jgi:hypothetical protein
VKATDFAKFFFNASTGDIIATTAKAKVVWGLLVYLKIRGQNLMVGLAE